MLISSCVTVQTCITYTCLQLTDVTKVGFVYMNSFVLKITILFVCVFLVSLFIHVDAVIVVKSCKFRPILRTHGH